MHRFAIPTVTRRSRGWPAVEIGNDECGAENRELTQRFRLHIRLHGRVPNTPI